ncbi:MAG: 2-oxoglutarate and iron-dependent oxygenase domain-containing protein [Acidimicrobiales bacterium]
MSDGDRRAGTADTELAKELTFGGPGVEVERDIRVIDLTDFDRRRDEIDDAIWDAATDIGFFQVTGHGIPQADIDRAFAAAEGFFSLPPEIKGRWRMPQASNSGWEFKTQRRPSTGTLDEKESYQVTISRMDRLGLWPSADELPGFRSTMESFERANHRLAMQLLSCFARKLGFADDFFTERHDPASPEYQSTLRLLHYLPVSVEQLDPRIWRAGAHTDYDCLTLLHQLPGQRGLQLSPGSEAARREDQTEPLGWTSVEPTAGTVTCNIGDMLMRWSDDRLPSTLHRVRMPRPDEHLGPRYSIAYFAQADCDAIVEGPQRRYEPITAADYLQQRIAANFSR